MRSASRGRGRILARGARAAPAAPPVDGAEAVPPYDPRGPLRRPRPMRDAPRAWLRRRGLGGGSSRGYRLSLPGRRSGALVAKRVVTGARSGLRASGGKGIAKKIAREAFVTGWLWCRHPQGCHRQRGRLTPTWAPKGAIQCRIAVTAMSCGQTPRRRHAGLIRTGWGLSSVKRRGGCRAESCGRAATGNPPVFNDAEPWRMALQAGPGTLTPRPCGRTATLASAARRNRARGHCRTPARRSRRRGRQA